MVATTRSRGGAPPHSAQEDEVSDRQKVLKSPVKSTAGKKDKVYRKSAPKAEFQQMRFPARAKTVKTKKTAKRLSLPNPPTTRKAKNKVDEDEDRKQKTLTQMRWVPSTHPSDDEGLDDVGSDEEALFDSFSMDDDSYSVAESNKTSSVKKGKRKSAFRAAAKSDETSSAAKKKPSEVKRNTNRGRKRRKTTGELDLELERKNEEEEEDEVSSSRYHTQTLTQMPSWKGLADMVQDSDEDIGFGLDDDLPQSPEQSATPQSKKRKRASPSALPAGPSGEPTRSATLAPGSDLPEHGQNPPPESTNPSVIPETPHHPRVARIEIPSSQPSPFTPNPELRYQSPINHGTNRRSPLKARSTNVDAPPPTLSLLRKRTRSEIPDSWSTVNGGMPSSGGTGLKRTPLKEIHFADYSMELGEDIDQRSRRTGNDDDDVVVKDSDDDFQGLTDDEVETPGTPSPHKQTADQAGDSQPVQVMTDVEAVIPHTALSDATSPGPSSNALQEKKTEDVFAELDASCDDDEVVASTPAEQVIVSEDVTSHGLQPGTPSHEGYAEIEEIRPEEQAATPTPKPSTRKSASQQRVSQSAAHRSPVAGSASAEVLSTPLSSVPKSVIQQSSSHPSTQPDSSPEAGAGGVPTQVLSVRKTATQQPSSLPTLQVDPELFAELVTTPIPSLRSSTQQPASNPTILRNSTMKPPVKEDDKDDTELETPSRSRRRPSSSSAVEKETPCSSPQKISPAMSQFIYTQIGHTQFGLKSQAFESQRVPFEIIRQMAPQTSRSDAIVTFGWQEVKRIVEGDKTYVFRDFRIPKNVSRIWFYITEPVCQLKYMAVISDFKLPGDADSQHKECDVAEFALGNRTKYAWELLQVYQLNNPVPLDRMKEEGWVEKDPLTTSFAYVPPAPLGALMGNLRCALFDESDEEGESQSQGFTTISQELAGQLMSDIEHSTQMQHTELSCSSPGHRLDRHSPHEQDDGDMVIPSSQDMADNRIRATPQRTKSASTKQVVFAKPNAPPAHSQQNKADKIDDSPPVMRQHSNPYPSQQHIIKSTVRPSQATTMSAPPSQSQQRRIEYCTISDSPSPPPVSQRPPVSSLPTMAVDDSPIQFRPTGELATQSSLGLTALLGSSQGFGLAGIGGEQDSLMDDSRIRMPPPLDQVGRWDSDEE